MNKIESEETGDNFSEEEKPD